MKQKATLKEIEINNQKLTNAIHKLENKKDCLEYGYSLLKATETLSRLRRIKKFILVQIVTQTINLNKINYNGLVIAEIKALSKQNKKALENIRNIFSMFTAYNLYKRELLRNDNILIK